MFSVRGRYRALLMAGGITVAIATIVAPGTSALAAGGGPATDTIEAVDYASLPSGFANWDDVFAEQNRLDAIAAPILAAKSETGFAGIYAAPENHRVDVYWHGTAPSRVSGAVARAGVSARLLPAEYSQADLVAQLQTLMAQPEVMRVAPRWDGSGLDVTVDAATLRAGGLQSLVAAPIHVTTGTGVAPTASKLDDSSPYWGAARIMNPIGNLCTSGFGVWFRGEPHMLTAAHCGFGVGTRYTDGGGQEMGVAAVSEKQGEYSLIRTMSAGYMWSGNYDSSTSRGVVGAQYALPGERVCRSSSFSNAVCGLKVIEWTAAVNFFPSDGSAPFTAFPLAHLEDPGHTLVASGDGDSGGSVYSKNGPNFVTARGIVSSAPLAGTVIPCTGVPSSTFRQCHWDMYFVDISWILESQNAQIMTI